MYPIYSNISREDYLQITRILQNKIESVTGPSYKQLSEKIMSYLEDSNLLNQLREGFLTQAQTTNSTNYELVLHEKAVEFVSKQAEPIKEQILQLKKGILPLVTKDKYQKIDADKVEAWLQQEVNAFNGKIQALAWLLGDGLCQSAPSSWQWTCKIL